MRLLYLAALLAGVTSFAQAQTEHRIVIKDHKFEPTEIKVAAGEKLKLIIENQDRSAEEFESYELNREKVVAGSSTIIVFVGPLAPGRYPFFGEFHIESAQGALIAE
ncbi:MAG: cupredoxin domain-containing protein [Lysobacterales bacterium]